MSNNNNTISSTGAGSSNNSSHSELPSYQDRQIFITCLALIVGSSYDFDHSNVKHEQQDLSSSSSSMKFRRGSSSTRSVPSATGSFRRQRTNSFKKRTSSMASAASTETSIDGCSDGVNVLNLEDNDNGADNSSNHNNDDDGGEAGDVDGGGGIDNNELNDNNIKEEQQIIAEMKQQQREREQQEQQARKDEQKMSQTAKLAQQRHLKRRHEVACQFLKSVTTQLLYEKEPEFVELFLLGNIFPLLEPLLQSPKMIKPKILLQTQSSQLKFRASSLRRSSSNASGPASNPTSPTMTKKEEENGGSLETSTLTDHEIETSLSLPEKRTTTDEKEEEEEEEYTAEEEESLNGSPLNKLPWVSADPLLQSHLEQLMTESTQQPGIRCLSWLLFQLLLSCDASQQQQDDDKKQQSQSQTSSDGYDARIRHWLKRMGVTLWVARFAATADQWKQKQQDVLDDDVDTQHQVMIQAATRKFEALEQMMADRLVKLAAASKSSDTQNQDTTTDDESQQQGMTNQRPKKRFSRQNVLKGIKIGGAGLLAGTLLAVTGGLAAPGIAIGLTALGLGAVAGTLLTGVASVAVVSLFGVAGGSLAAYKMNRRVCGLTEFCIQQELLPFDDDEGHKVGNNNKKNNNKKESAFRRKKSGPPPPPKKPTNNSNNNPRPELVRSVCISGWLRSNCDFQRPWGVSPWNPFIEDSVELLQRFYAIHNPPLIPLSKSIIQNWKDNQDILWINLKAKYHGCDPYQPFPSPNVKSKINQQGLSRTEEELVDRIIVEIGNVRSNEKGANKPTTTSRSNHQQPPPPQNETEAIKHDDNDEYPMITNTSSEYPAPSDFESPPTLKESDGGNDAGEDNATSKDDTNKLTMKRRLDHLDTVWDYQSRYSGEMYTILWERRLMKEMSDSVTQLVGDLAGTAGKAVLALTAAAPLVIASVLPLAILRVKGENLLFCLSCFLSVTSKLMHASLSSSCMWIHVINHDDK